MTFCTCLVPIKLDSGRQTMHGGPSAGGNAGVSGSFSSMAPDPGPGNVTAPRHCLGCDCNSAETLATDLAILITTVKT